MERVVAAKLLSIVVPAYNEGAVLDTFHARLMSVVEALNLACEVIYVNDGSTDPTLGILQRLKQDDPRIGVLDLSRNFGKEAAMTAGLHHASGDAVVVIDADLQDPPELIPEFVRVWQEEGVDVVYGQRSEREGESWLKRTTAALFYRTMQHFGQIRLPQNTGDFRLLDRRALDALKQLPEHHRFMKGLFTWIGFEQRAVPYRRAPRQAGATKWSYWRLWNFAIEGLTSYSVAPLQIASYLGIVVAFVSFVYGIFIIFKTLAYGDPVAGYPSLVVIVLFLGGVQLLFIGIIGEYLGRIFNETKQRPLYLIASFNPPSVDPAARSAVVSAVDSSPPRPLPSG